jgi:hypothetical protein
MHASANPTEKPVIIAACPRPEVAAEQPRGVESVARQVEHATAFVARKGFGGLDHHFTDDGSAAPSSATSASGPRLFNALSPRPPFPSPRDDEESRLGREATRPADARGHRRRRARVLLPEDRERTLDTATDKVMMSLSAFASEMERERARQRTHDALLRKARAGHVTGGLVFGYRNQPVLEGARRSHVTRIIDPVEAFVVRQIFERAAEGWGVKRIAAELNEQAAAAPMPRRAGRPRGWAPSSVREVLHRELYAGRILWNRTAKVIRGGAKHQRDRAPEELVTVEAPELRIVPEEITGRRFPVLGGARFPSGNGEQ